MYSNCSFIYILWNINALEQNNIKPLFCDINNTLTPDLKKIKIEKNTKFIVASSVYGNIPNIKEIKKLCKKII